MVLKKIIGCRNKTTKEDIIKCNICSCQKSKGYCNQFLRECNREKF